MAWARARVRARVTVTVRVRRTDLETNPSPYPMATILYCDLTMIESFPGEVVKARMILAPTVHVPVFDPR